MKRLVAAALGVVLASGLAACGGDSSEDSSETIKIGAWFPLSGPVAASGIPQEAGARAAVDAVNAEGGINGKKVEYITRDNAYDPQQTLQVARELVTKDGVVAIVGANGTAQSEAAFPFVLEQSEVPIFGTYGGLSTWYDPPREGLFGTQTLYETQGQVVADWAAEDGAKSVTIVRSDPDAFKTVADSAAGQLEKAGVKVAEVVSKFNSTDYGPYVAEVKKKNSDAVILILAAPEAAAFVKEAALQKVDAPKYGYVPATSNVVLSLAGDDADGFRGVSLTLPPEEDNADVQQFRDELKKSAPNVEPTAEALANYASMKVFLEILKTIDGDITKESIVEAIESAEGIDVKVAPVMSFSKDKHLGANELMRVEAKGGKFVAVGDFVGPKE